MGPKTRRRGTELVEAILDAAWQQLLESGYPGFTHETVARMAGTSKPVLYRRWPTKEDLLNATLARRGEIEVAPPPNTGSLRGDVLAVLTRANNNPERNLSLLSAHVGGLYSSGLTPMDLRKAYRGSAPSSMSQVAHRALERGEVQVPIPEEIMEIPNALFREELFLTLKPLPTSKLEWIVDKVFLPLVRIYVAELPAQEGQQAGA